ncbi:MULTISPECIES: hypothetical protein [Mycolicibacterium]|uniref:Uncharacterized protein n=1 Tax=Mycolicibacterium porcinum TaxID=39693 RepID=A0ABV3VBC1_9MYCO|nr:hypothetical protein [Mycolicibacterium fortuitum]
MTEDSPQPLDSASAARWEAAQAALRELANAVVEGSDPETRQAAAEAARQALSGLDLDALRDALNVPEDAGDHHNALAAILRRIPDGWGRWISCDAGWYSLIVSLDSDLAAIDPHYALHQCKEKFGTLRFYAHASEELPDEAHRRFAERIAAAERASATTCESCGTTTGSLHERRDWFKTLCESCATENGYRPLPSGDDS